MVNDQKGFEQKPQANPEKNVGGQGLSGQGLGGQAVAHAGMPISGGKVPSKKGVVSMGELSAPQNGVMPQVGK